MTKRRDEGPAPGNRHEARTHDSFGDPVTENLNTGSPSAQSVTGPRFHSVAPECYRLVIRFDKKHHYWSRIIVVAANRGDTEPHRLDRLQRVAHAALDAGLPVNLLFDHKGALSANFTQFLTPTDLPKLAMLWEQENEYQLGEIYERGYARSSTQNSTFQHYLNIFPQYQERGYV